MMISRFLKLLNARLKATITPLVVKDRVLNHYTLDVLRIE